MQALQLVRQEFSSYKRPHEPYIFRKRGFDWSGELLRYLRHAVALREMPAAMLAGDKTLITNLL